VAVIGGGNSAIDAARTAIRLGANTVTIYYRRERKDMPAQEAEIRAAEEEGVQIEYLTAPIRVVTQNGTVSGLELTRMMLGQFDRSGRKRPEPIAGSEFLTNVDTVIAAIGQRADLEFLPKESCVHTDRGAIRAEKGLRTTNAKVWAGGDAVTGPAMVIDAIKAGQDAAREIDEAIREAYGEKPWVPSDGESIDVPLEVDEDVVEQPQALMPEVSASERRKDFREVELGYSMKTAMAEARRCMRCDAEIE